MTPASEPASVRVRFAPSPTGHLHVGGARTAIFNWLFARRHQGHFIIRVEDTDQERSTRESEEMVLSDLRWLGLAWDEGPDVGGPHAPYRQSERMHIYARVAEDLMTRGYAYRCFCTEAELEAKRTAAEARGEAPHYDGTCSRLSPQESEKRRSERNPFVIRFGVRRDVADSDRSDVTIHDLIRGEVSWRAESLGDFIVLRSDGMPTYNFSVVVDDHEMEITHVIRAEEHLTNTHRQVLIYRAMGWEEPSFAHVSLILGEDRSKLSKRHGATSVAAFAEAGFLPEAMVNFLALLGWSMPGGAEQFSAAEATAAFSFERVNSAPAVFDENKLRWLNGQYIHQMDPSLLAELLAPFAAKAGYLRGKSDEFMIAAARMSATAMTTLADVATTLRFVFSWDASLIVQDEEKGTVLREAGVAYLTALLALLDEKGVPASGEELKVLNESLRERTGRKGKGLFMPLRLATTGELHGPELAAAIPLLELAARSPDLAPVVPIPDRVRSLITELEAR